MPYRKGFGYAALMNKRGQTLGHALADSPVGMAACLWVQSVQGGITEYDCIKHFSDIDFNDELKKFKVRTLVAHGDDDQIVPIVASALVTALVKGATLKIYNGGSHGRATTRPDEFNAELLEFIQSGAQRVPAPSEGAALTH